MLGNALSGWHLVIIVFIALLLFGSTKLPALAKGLGESIRVLRKETQGDGPTSETVEKSATDTTASDAAPTQKAD